jgi:hypothetical protein
MTDTPAGRIVCDSMLLGEFVDKSVFLKVGFGLVLDVVVQCEYHLAVVVNLGSSNVEELLCDRPCVVVAHTMVGSECDIVSCFDLLSRSKSYGVLLGDLLNKSLGVLDGRRFLVLESRRSGCALKLGVESMLSRARLVGTVLG